MKSNDEPKFKRRKISSKSKSTHASATNCNGGAKKPRQADSNIYHTQHITNSNNLVLGADGAHKGGTNIFNVGLDAGNTIPNKTSNKKSNKSKQNLKSKTKQTSKTKTKQKGKGKNKSKKTSISKSKSKQSGSNANTLTSGIIGSAGIIGHDNNGNLLKRVDRSHSTNLNQANKVRVVHPDAKASSTRVDTSSGAATHNFIDSSILDLPSVWFGGDVANLDEIGPFGQKLDIADSGKDTFGIESGVGDEFDGLSGSCDDRTPHQSKDLEMQDRMVAMQAQLDQLMASKGAVGGKAVGGKDGQSIKKRKSKSKRKKKKKKAKSAKRKHGQGRQRSRETDELAQQMDEDIASGSNAIPSKTRVCALVGAFACCLFFLFHCFFLIFLFYCCGNWLWCCVAWGVPALTTLL